MNRISDRRLRGTGGSSDAQGASADRRDGECDGIERVQGEQRCDTGECDTRGELLYGREGGIAQRDASRQIDRLSRGQANGCQASL